MAATVRHSVDCYARSVSSIAASTSSPSTADASPRLDSSLSLSSTTSTSSNRRRRAPRRSLSMLGKLPKDFSALLRSHNSTRRNSLNICQTDSAAKVLLADYADVHPYDPTTAKDMHARKDDDRPARKSKPENRFYRFLTRSRSRSRTKLDSSLDHHDSGFPELGHDFPQASSHSRQSSTSRRGKSPERPNPSRPLSTTTTATNTTIMPPTPKARRTAGLLATTPEITPYTNENTSRPPSPKAPSATRKKLHNLFGIPLTSSRKSSSRKSSISSTRPNTPDPHAAPNPPPLPDTSPGHDPILSSPRRSLAPPPLDTSRAQSPSLTARSRQRTFDSLESSTSTSASTSSRREHALKSQKLFLARIPVTPSTSSHSDDRSSMSTALVVSGPTKHRRTHTSQSDSLPSTPITPTTPVQRNTLTPQPRHTDGNTGIPRISHTPATPQRLETNPPRLGQRKDSTDSSRRPREMSIVDEERSLLEEVADKGKSRDTSRQGYHSVIGKMKSTNVRSTRHGSFDFERPGWGSIVRSTSVNSTSTANTIPQGSGDNLTTRSGDSGPGKRKEIPPPDALRRRGSQRTAPSPIPPLEPNYTGASSSTTHSRSTTGTNGLTSSVGRNTGKRMLGGGVAKLVGIPHGPFSFEPPVPSPTVSTTTYASGASDRERELREAEEREKVERRRKRREIMRQEAAVREKDAWRSSHQADFHPSVAPTSLGFRSASKGRSLDLGLGLSWAPSKVRQDALMPSSTFPLDKRSLSASSRIGLGKNWTEEDAEADLSKLGKGIAEKFRIALDAEGYTTFKQYVHRFDAQEIPIDGPDGIIERARRLLDRSSNLTEDQKSRLTDNLVKIILQNA